MRVQVPGAERHDRDAEPGKDRHYASIKHIVTFARQDTELRARLKQPVKRYPQYSFPDLHGLVPGFRHTRVDSQGPRPNLAK